MFRTVLAARLYEVYMGNENEIITFGKTDGKEIKCTCPNCKKKMNHSVMQSVHVDGMDPEDQTDWRNDFQIIQCLGCDAIHFRHLNYFSEYFDYDCNGTTEKLYPPIDEMHRNDRNYDMLPYNLENIYKETISSFNNSNHILCAIGIRAILEGICKDNEIKKGKVERIKAGVEVFQNSAQLDGKINGLNEKGIISNKQCKVLHELRFLGNDAVHDLSVPTKKEIGIALDIIEHMIDDIYDIPEKSKVLERKRETKK
jgi:hypothetical protein